MSDAGSPGPRPERDEVRVRRAPRIVSFLLAGALLGAIVALVLTLAFPPNSEFPASQVFGFLLLMGVVAGGALGAVVALVFDRVLSRRTRVLAAERELGTERDDRP